MAGGGGGEAAWGGARRSSAGFHPPPRPELPGGVTEALPERDRDVIPHWLLPPHPQHAPHQGGAHTLQRRSSDVRVKLSNPGWAALLAAAGAAMPLAAQAPAVTVSGVGYAQYLYQLKDTANHVNNFDRSEERRVGKEGRSRWS